MFLATLLADAAVAAPTTEPATNVGATSATLNGTVDAPGSVYFEYGTTTPYGLTTADADRHRPRPGLGHGHRPDRRDDLPLPDRVRPTAPARTARSRPRPTPSRPRSPTSGRATSPPTSATVTASINTNGSATTYRIEYGTTTRYGSETTPAQTPSTATSSISAKLTDLRAYTRYHWRTVATNAAGTTRGADRSFRTARLPTGVTLALSRKTVPWGGDLRLGGRVSGAGVGGMTVELQQQRFPQDQGFVEVGTARTGSDGGYLFTIPRLWTTTRYRVVTRTQVVVTSPEATARSRVRVGIRARLVARKRARIQGDGPARRDRHRSRSSSTGPASAGSRCAPRR